MMLSKRGKATLLSALAFGAALVIYFATRTHQPQETVRPPDSPNTVAADEGRSLGRQLGDMLKSGQKPASPQPTTHNSQFPHDKTTDADCDAHPRVR